MSNDSSQSLDSPTNEAVMARLLELENRTGYRMQQCNGQRRYWNPNWSGPAPPRGSEVFVGKIPRDLFEDEIVPVFEEVGRIYELRLMMDFSGFNRGYAFVTFSCKEEANRAIKMLDNYEIRPGLKIGVCRSVDNCRLFVGSIPKDKGREEIRLAMSEITDDVSDVIIDPGTNIGELNRGYAYVEYSSHRAAAMARRKLIPGRITLFGYEVAVDWADPESDIKSDTTMSCRSVTVRNLRPTTTEFSVWSAFNNLKPGSIEIVNRNQDQDFATVNFHKQEDAMNACKMMDGKFIDGQEVHVSLSKSEVSLKRIGSKFNVRVDSTQATLPDNCMRSMPSAHIMNSMNRRTGIEPSTTYFGNMQNMQPSFPMTRNFSMTANAQFDHCSPRPMDDKVSMSSDMSMLGPSTFNRKLRPVLTLDHIASIKCPVTLLSELCNRLNLGMGGPHYTLLLDEVNGQCKCRYVYQVNFGNRTYMPPISSDTVEEAKRVAAQHVIDNIEPWLKSKLETMVVQPPYPPSRNGPLPPRHMLHNAPDSNDNMLKMQPTTARFDNPMSMHFYPQHGPESVNVNQ